VTTQKGYSIPQWVAVAILAASLSVVGYFVKTIIQDMRDDIQGKVSRAEYDALKERVRDLERQIRWRDRQ
jgi:hypothetical protein